MVGKSQSTQKEEMTTNNLVNLRCFHKFGYAAIGALLDMHLYSDGSKLYASYGIRNSWLFFFSCIPFVALLTELINFIISLLNISHKPDLSKEIEKSASRFQINLRDIEYLYLLERSKFTVIFDKISLFIPIISLFALYLYRSRVILKLHSGKKIKFDFFYPEDAEEFKNFLIKYSKASFINQDQASRNKALDILLTLVIFLAEKSKNFLIKYTKASFINKDQISRNDVLDILLTIIIFFSIQLLMIIAIAERTLEIFVNPVHFINEDIELFFLTIFGFLLPLLVKIFDSRLNWQTNYRYLLWRRSK